MMETLVVAEHRNQYYGSGKPHGPAQFGSSLSIGFKDISCRAFESGGGLLPSSPLMLCPFSLSNGSVWSPRTPTPTAYENSPYQWRSGDHRMPKRNVKSSPITINFKDGKKETPVIQTSPFSERWAGPAYSMSPPPSSVPIPKFSLKPKRSVSLELPRTVSDSPVPVAKSAPASPTRELKRSAISFVCNGDDATKTLRRILNLDVVED